MRAGEKPLSVHGSTPAFPAHRIIVPLYVPNLEGYYKESLDVLRLCLGSLYHTTVGRANITMVSNDACPRVITELESLQNAGWLDQVVLNRANRGKVDGVISVARGAFEDFITISDCDVLFVPGWLDAIEEIFRAFPECGFASPAPNPRSAWSHTSAAILGGIANCALRREKVVPEVDLDRFACSIGWPGIFEAEHRRSQVVLKRKGVTACVGAGHFVFTLPKTALAAVPAEPCRKALTGSPEERWIDGPIDAAGFWRLSTTRAFAYHMGNVLEPWMVQEFERYRVAAPGPAAATGSISPGKAPWTRWVPLRLRRKLAGAVRMGFKRFGKRNSSEADLLPAKPGT